MQLRSLVLAGAMSSLLMLAAVPAAPAVTPALLLPAMSTTPSPTPTPAPVAHGPRIYKLPYGGGMSFDVCQGNNHAGWTHVGLAAYAWDFCMPIGTPVLAARGGTVVAVRQSSNVGGWGAKFADDANYVVIDHWDGSSALYMHLMLNGSRVKVGDQVQTGQLIAYSGNTGWTSAPHLHFMVMKTADDDYYTQSLPVLFTDVAPDGLPMEDNSYVSGNAPVDPRYLNPGSPPPFVPFWVETFRTSVLWSGSDSKAVQFGPAAPWQFFQVVAPQSGPRLQVVVAGTGAPAFIPAADAGPSGPPPNTPPGGVTQAAPAAPQAAAPNPAATPAPSAPPNPSPSSAQVVVASGDTLFGIAKAHGVAFDKVVTLNAIKNPDELTVGQVLKLG